MWVLNVFDLKVFLSIVDWQIFVNFEPCVGVHHGVIFSFGSAKVCSPAIFETCFSFDKDTWIASIDYYMYFNIIVLFSIDISSLVNKLCNVIIFSLLINVVIELSCFNTSSLHTFSLS